MQKSKTVLPDIFEYIDFRVYLSDYYKARKRLDPSFSHAFICRLLGQKPEVRSYFSNIIRGRVPVGDKTLQLLIDKVLQLSASEANYFRNLVYFQQSKLPQEKESYLTAIAKYNRSPNKLIDEDQLSYFSDPNHVTIRALLEVIPFKEGDNPEILAKALRVPIGSQRIAKSLSLLKNLGLIVTLHDGRLFPKDPVISSPPKSENELIRLFQIKCFQAGERAISSGQPCQTHTQTLSLSKDAAQLVAHKMNQLFAEVQAIAAKDTKVPDGVYQLNIQIYKMTGKI